MQCKSYASHIKGGNLGVIALSPNCHRCLCHQLILITFQTAIIKRMNGWRGGKCPLADALRRSRNQLHSLRNGYGFKTSSSDQLISLFSICFSVCFMSSQPEPPVIHMNAIAITRHFRFLLNISWIIIDPRLSLTVYDEAWQESEVLNSTSANCTVQL